MTTETTNKATIEKPEEKKEIDVEEVANDIHRSLTQIAWDLGYMKGQQDVVGWAWLAAGVGMLLLVLIQVAVKLLAR